MGRAVIDEVETAGKVAERISWGSAGGGLAWSWFFSSDGVMYLSFVVAVVASVYSIWRRRRQGRLVEAEHALKMGLMRDVREQNRKLYAAKMRAIELGDIEGADSIQLAQPTTFGDLEL